MKVRTVMLLLVVLLLFSGCAIHRLTGPVETIIAYEAQVSDQCRVQPQLDWCGGGR